jgi:glycerate kinase
MRVLVAFDKFKDAISADAAGECAAAALRKLHPDWSIDLCPLTDGGESFSKILTRSARGVTTEISVTGPRGVPVAAPIGSVAFGAIPQAARRLLELPELTSDDARLAIIDMASASGLALLTSHERDPWRSTSIGTGQLIRAAADHDAAAILLGVGGSATNDLGLGALAALGERFAPRSGLPIEDPVPTTWNRIQHITGHERRNLPPIRIACDVKNPLLGPHGCAAIYGPQKGLQPRDLTDLENESARIAKMLCAVHGAPETIVDRPGTGAAGGIAFGLMVAAGAKQLPGFELAAAWLDLDARIAAADIVITGEGRFDATSLAGKGPGAIAARAMALGRSVHVFAGMTSDVISPQANFRVHAITPAGLPLDQALRDTTRHLAAAIQLEFP